MNTGADRCVRNPNTSTTMYAMYAGTDQRLRSISAIARLTTINATAERLTDQHGTDPELHHQAAAIPAGRKRGHHDAVTVVALPHGLALFVAFACVLFLAAALWLRISRPTA